MGIIGLYGVGGLTNLPVPRVFGVRFVGFRARDVKVWVHDSCKSEAKGVPD